jgi:phosphoglycolate phosphatase-like HAD superfamily hydrolase
MASCASDGDCRAGYACLNLTGHFDPVTGQPTTTLNPLGAVLAESSGSGKVCAVKLLDYSATETNSSAVCVGDTAASAAGGSAAGATSGGATSGGGAGGSSSGASGDGGAAG